MITTYKKLREVRFNDGFLHRMNQGVLEWKSAVHGTWNATIAINLDDIDLFADLEQNPFEQDKTRDQVREVIRLACIPESVVDTTTRIDDAVEQIFRLMERE
jgi:hypothetical protein